MTKHEPIQTDPNRGGKSPNYTPEQLDAAVRQVWAPGKEIAPSAVKAVLVDGLGVTGGVDLRSLEKNMAPVVIAVAEAHRRDLRASLPPAMRRAARDLASGIEIGLLDALATHAAELRREALHEVDAVALERRQLATRCAMLEGELSEGEARLAALEIRLAEALAERDAATVERDAARAERDSLATRVAVAEAGRLTRDEIAAVVRELAKEAVAATMEPTPRT